jgi:TonB family protein
VEVQVLVDFDGTVVAATAISGHPLLQAAAVNAARKARFTPMMQDGEPVKVVGVIQYNFVVM